MKKFAKSVFIVLNDKGLHARPSTELVKCAAKFDASVSLIYKDFVVNAKSILGILMLAAKKGAKVKIEAFGHDAEQAIQAIMKLAQNRFNIKY